MKMRDALMEVYNIFTKDETLLRLLYYTSVNIYDITNVNDANHPLNPTKPNILSLPVAQRWDIIYDLIKSTKNIDELDSVKKNRICVYSGNRSPDTRRSYRISGQSIYVDVHSHLLFDGIDFRMSWICDRINELLFNTDLDSAIGGLGFDNGVMSQGSMITGYNSYRLIYSFQDFN